MIARTLLLALSLLALSPAPAQPAPERPAPEGPAVVPLWPSGAPGSE